MWTKILEMWTSESGKLTMHRPVLKSITGANHQALGELRLLVQLSIHVRISHWSKSSGDV